MKRAQAGTRLYARLRAAGIGQSLIGSNGNVGVEAGIEILDATQEKLGYLYGGDLLGHNELA